MKRIVVGILFLLMVSLVIPAAADSILPTLATPKPETVMAPSLHNATALNPRDIVPTDDGGILCKYSGVTYELYEIFGVALSRAGYSLVSNEKDGQGVYTIVVSDGSISLTIVYDVDNAEMTVAYPLGAEPRSVEKYVTYTELKAGEPFTISEGVTASISGWQRVDKWVRWYYSSMYMISSRTDDYTSDENNQYVILLVDIKNQSPVDIVTADQIEAVDIGWVNGDELAASEIIGGYGKDWHSINTRPKGHGEAVIKTMEDGQLAIAFSLTDVENKSGGTLAVTFTIPSYATRYVYYLDLSHEPQEGN